jgi:ferredoxin
MATEASACANCGNVSGEMFSVEDTVIHTLTYVTEGNKKKTIKCLEKDCGDVREGTEISLKRPPHLGGLLENTI